MAAGGEEAELVVVLEPGEADGAVRGGFLEGGGDGIERKDWEGVDEALVIGGHVAVEERAVEGRSWGGGGRIRVADAVEVAEDKVDGGGDEEDEGDDEGDDHDAGVERVVLLLRRSEKRCRSLRWWWRWEVG